MLARQIVDLHQEQIVSRTLATLKTFAEPIWLARKGGGGGNRNGGRGGTSGDGFGDDPAEHRRRFARLGGESPRLLFGQFSSKWHAHRQPRTGAARG
jgi:hypothetical protein